MTSVDNSNSQDRESPRRRAGTAALNQWVLRIVSLADMAVQSRLRGNTLHILLQGVPCPDPEVVVPRLQRALSTPLIEQVLPPGTPLVYRVVVYGRVEPTASAWARAFSLHAPTQPLETEHAPEGVPESTPDPTASAANGTAVLSLRDLARQGQPDAIARYLSQYLTDLNIAVRVRLDNSHSTSVEPVTTGLRRMRVLCESGYTPDLTLLAERIAQKLRELDLQGFQDAVVFGQVSGEPQPEWVLRVDLTPPDQILRDWGRWGDVQAIAYLLNTYLRLHDLEVSALLKDSTLHLTCEGRYGVTPDQGKAIGAIAPQLEALAPQGIHAATIYGVVKTQAQVTATDHASPAETPAWIHWLNLPAAAQLALHPPTLELAQQGNLEAIGFLLTRLLNPDLEARLTTGGVRVQVRQKGDLLHIMTDALTCPTQKEVGGAIVRFLQPLAIPNVHGVRVYGRRAGQRSPQWSYGEDFVSRKRLVPEVTPEFAASDAYLGELLSSPGAIVPQAEAEEPVSLKGVALGLLHGCQRALIRTQIFAPLETAESYAAAPEEKPAENRAIVGLIWGTVGVLLAVQADWLLGRWTQAKTEEPPAVASSPVPKASTVKKTPLPKISLNKPRTKDTEAFNGSGFTQSDRAPTGSEAAPIEKREAGTATLMASPLQPQATPPEPSQPDAYPTFNSRQLDAQITAYRQYLQQHGTPDVLIIGSSRALRGVDPTAIRTLLAAQGYDDVKVFNFGVNGATAQVMDWLVRQVLPQEALPKLILWADGARAFNSGRSDITFNGIQASQGYRSLLAGRPPIPGTLTAQAAPATSSSAAASGASPTDERYQTFNQQLNQRLGALSATYARRNALKEDLREWIARTLPTGMTLTEQGAIAIQDLSNSTSPAASAAHSPAPVLTEGQQITDVYGFLPLANRFNPVTYYQKYSRVSGEYDSDYENFSLRGRQADALANVAQFTQARQIRLVFVNLPLTNDYLDTTRKRHEDTFQREMLQLSQQLGFVYRDLTQAFPARTDFFSDPSHLNRYGGYEVSRRLVQDAMIPWSTARSPQP